MFPLTGAAVHSVSQASLSASFVRVADASQDWQVRFKQFNADLSLLLQRGTLCVPASARHLCEVTDDLSVPAQLVDVRPRGAS